jgi:hypothetical protein
MLRRVIVGASVAAAGWATYVWARRWYGTWGFEPEEQAKALPGDDIVPDGTNLLTRGITIDAPPEAVWPWLVQMGYGRAGWYSYDQLDMKGRSADTIVPELQKLEVGDVLPTHPDGGFTVKLVEPNRALAVYVDTDLVESWQKKPAASISVKETPGLAMSGGFLERASPQEFKISWAFVLEPAGPGRTRLIERTRGWFGPGAPATRMLMPMLGFGVFVMTRQQMIGIRRRVERVASLERVEREAAVAVPMAAHEGNGKGETPTPETVVASAG